MIPISDTADLGQAIRTARKLLDLTQPQLAMATGVGVRFIVDLEAGKPTVQLALVLRVIEALGGHVQLSGLPVKAQPLSIISEDPTAKSQTALDEKTTIPTDNKNSDSGRTQ